jgi:hypothetical protein
VRVFLHPYCLRQFAGFYCGCGHSSFWLLWPQPQLLMQVEQILQINELQTVTKEVVEAARENLVIGLA